MYISQLSRLCYVFKVKEKNNRIFKTYFSMKAGNLTAAAFETGWTGKEKHYFPIFSRQKQYSFQTNTQYTHANTSQHGCLRIRVQAEAYTCYNVCVHIKKQMTSKFFSRLTHKRHITLMIKTFNPQGKRYYSLITRSSVNLKT